MTTTTDTRPTVERISSVIDGIAGQIAYNVTVRYPDELGGTTHVLTFASSRHGGPVVMVDETFGQTFVSDPDRFGRFSPRWVRLFFGEDVA